MSKPESKRIWLVKLLEKSSNDFTKRKIWQTLNLSINGMISIYLHKMVQYFSRYWNTPIGIKKYRFVQRSAFRTYKDEFDSILIQENSENYDGSC